MAQSIKHCNLLIIIYINDDFYFLKIKFLNKNLINVFVYINIVKL